MVPYLFLSDAVGKGNEPGAIEPIAGQQFPETNPFGFLAASGPMDCTTRHKALIR